ncbi:MAG: cupin domain-containing protein [Proteobacteria bacterium]|nr:cupin domain-containing protein [Pseudomonadota bacterium]
MDDLRMSQNTRAPQQTEAQKKFGVEYYHPGQQVISGSRDGDLYTYTTYIGTYLVNVEKGDCAYTYDGKGMAHVQPGPCKIQSTLITTVIRGYAPALRSTAVGRSTYLPYVNGCSTRQVFTPDRIGDPTLQLLHMPPHSSEQVHHIHSTARVVHVLEGRGRSLVGMEQWVEKQELVPGMSIILHPMCPHHFETDDNSLLVLPLHIFSSPPGGTEFDHPMFNGTHRIG